MAAVLLSDPVVFIPACVVASAFYLVSQFLRGKTTLSPLGEVRILFEVEVPCPWLKEQDLIPH